MRVPTIVLVSLSLVVGLTPEDYEEDIPSLKKRIVEWKHERINEWEPKTVMKILQSKFDPVPIDADEINLVYYPGMWSPFKSDLLTIEHGHMDGLKRAKLNNTYPIKLILPGFFQTCRSDFPTTIIKAYRQRMIDHPKVKYNIFCLNWKDYTGNIKHTITDFLNVCTTLEEKVIRLTPMIARNATLIINFLLDKGAMKSVKDIHLIGFDIGSHIAGMIGDNLKADHGKKVGRITALDPPSYKHYIPWKLKNWLEDGNCSYYHEPSRMLNKSDADFVDVVHTDAARKIVMSESDVSRTYGTRDTMGHVDYFPNGGGSSDLLHYFCSYHGNRFISRMQLKCVDTALDCLIEFSTQIYFCRDKYANEAACRHNLAYHFYAQSILDPTIKTYKANSYEDFKKYYTHPIPVIFGEFINTTNILEGVYYLDITPKRIFKNVCFKNIPDVPVNMSTERNVTYVTQKNSSNKTTTVLNATTIAKLCKENKADDVRFWYNPGAWSDGTSLLLHYNINETFIDSKLRNDLPFKILIHGFLDGAKSGFSDVMTKAYIKNMRYRLAPQYNIISVGWGALAAHLHDVNSQFYTNIATHNVEIVAERTTQFILFLRDHGYIDKKFSKVHILGHSLGAIIAGRVGFKLQNITNETVQRITGLDPAGPAVPDEKRLERRSARFVDIVHTDMNNPAIDFNLFGGFRLIGLGTDKQSGDIDFYPNGGLPTLNPSYGEIKIAPFDIFELKVHPHILSYVYYAKSIDWSIEIMAYKCSTYKSYQCCKPLPTACPKDKAVRFGEYIDMNQDKWEHGKYFLTLKQGHAFDECTYLSCV